MHPEKFEGDIFSWEYITCRGIYYLIMKQILKMLNGTIIPRAEY
jgi:hypothetical protein